jgi:hypothetical protein
MHVHTTSFTFTIHHSHSHHIRHVCWIVVPVATLLYFTGSPSCEVQYGTTWAIWNPN